MRRKPIDVPSSIVDSYIDTQEDDFIDAEAYARLQDLFTLHILCDSAKDDAASWDEVRHRLWEESWDDIRHWLRSHSAEDAHEAARMLGDYKTTSLHLACRNCPPADIVDLLLTAAPETVEWADSFGWLPLHYACANEASEDVLRKLADAYPDSKTATDRRGRTPLHFALGNTVHQASPATVVLLSSTGAAAFLDENGMLPLHYACAYGASEEALHVLTDNNPDSITATDKKGRTPLHFALGNADRPASPAVVRLLLSQNRGVVSRADREGGLPLHILAARANSLQEAQFNERANTQKCLDLYLQAETKLMADFFTALQSLPDWLRDRAVVTPNVQRLLNERISQRFPTAVLLLDAYFLCAIIVTYHVNVVNSLDSRFNDNPGKKPTTASLSPLYIGAAYFLLREVVQMLSLLSLGMFQSYLRDTTNWVDVTFIFLVLYWTVLMNTGKGDDDRFRTGTALSVIIMWTAVLSFLKSTYIDFAVFVNGVFHVLQRLAAFLILLIIILVAFAQMFVTVFRQTSYCTADKNATQPQYLNSTATDNESCVPIENPFCNYWYAFLKVYTMLLGEVSEDDFNGSMFAMILFVIFMFLAVILLANVLIAIVTDSYGVIKNERAEFVFWSNRLDFVAEMDAISSSPWKNRLKNSFSERHDNSYVEEDHTSGRNLWKKLLDLFKDEIEDRDFFSLELWCYTLLRIFTAIFIIPCWLVLGVASAGWLWPPQVREGLLTQRVSKNNPGNIKQSEQRMAQVNALGGEFRELRNEIELEMEMDRKEMTKMKWQLKDMESDIIAEVKNIKQIMTVLFDLQWSIG